MEVFKDSYKVRLIYTNCLAEACYIVSSAGEAAIIDPLRDIDDYLQILKSENLKLKYAMETHFHADFISGHVDLQKKTGCEIIFGPEAKPAYPVRNLAHEEKLPLGEITLQALHTPGHTPESTCYVLLDKSGKPDGVFTGDTLFVGDVGRPDLLEKLEITREEQVGRLYHSLHDVLCKLPDETVVYPAHGAGSPCGKSLGSEKTSTIGHEKANNYALKLIDKKEFTEAVLTGLNVPPQYFVGNALMNRGGPTGMDTILEASFKPLTVEQVEEEIKKGAMVLDTRTKYVWCDGAIPKSLQVGLDGMYAINAGSVIPDLETPMVMVSDVGKEKDSIVRLGRVGYSGVRGYLEGGFEAWKKAGKEVQVVERVVACDFTKKIGKEKMHILEVRRPGELEKSYVVPDSLNIPVVDLEKRIGEIIDHKEHRWYVVCGTAYRATIASSILKQHGFKDVVLVMDGVKKIQECIANHEKRSNPKNPESDRDCGCE